MVAQFLEIYAPSQNIWNSPPTHTAVCGSVAHAVSTLQMQETWVPSLSQEDPLKREMATQSSILAWRIPMDREACQAAVYWVTKS